MRIFVGHLAPSGIPTISLPLCFLVFSTGAAGSDGLFVLRTYLTISIHLINHWQRLARVQRGRVAQPEHVYHV